MKTSLFLAVGIAIFIGTVGAMGFQRIETIDEQWTCYLAEAAYEPKPTLRPTTGLQGELDFFFHPVGEGDPTALAEAGYWQPTHLICTITTDIGNQP